MYAVCCCVIHKAECNKKKRMHGKIWLVVLFYAFAGEKRREVTDLQKQIERFVYTQVAIQTGDAASIRKLRERVQLK